MPELTDRELIVALAEKVMGWTVITSGRGSLVAFSPRDEDDRILATTHPWESVDWNPLTSIADAWMLVEAMVARGMVVIVKGDGLRAGDSNPKWTVLTDANPRTDALTAPRAICLAAAHAVGLIPEVA